MKRTPEGLLGFRRISHRWFHKSEGRELVAKSSRVQDLLGLSKPAIAIGYFAEPPAGVAKYEAGEVPAGCSFWQLAQEGASFYTEQSDHYNCAVGAYTHSIPLPPERAEELGETIGFMVEQRYLREAEVPMIPVLAESPRYVAYGPVDDAEFKPDVVAVAAEPARAMLLYEAALRAGAGGIAPNIVGRPGCAVEALTMGSGETAMSLGCKGNRTFTGLPDNEMYVSFPGSKWEAVVEALTEIVQSNESMGSYYNGQKKKFSY